MLCAGAAVLSGCGTRPVTQSVTGLDTYRIAQAIRCEMRDAAINLSLQRIARSDETLAAQLNRDYLANRYPGKPGEQVDPSHVAWLRAEYESEQFSLLLSGQLKPRNDIEFSDALEIYRNIFIAYSFSFDLSQTHDAGGGIDLLSTFTKGVVTSPLTASFKGKRQSKREFILADKVGELLVDRATIRQCNVLREELGTNLPPNGAYPIAGKLDLREILLNFINMNQAANLVGKTATDITPTQTDTLTFTTTLKTGLKPKLEITPIKIGTEVKGSALDFSVERVDEHKVTIAMNLPKRDETVTKGRNAKEQAAYVEQRTSALEAIEIQRKEDREDEISKLRQLLISE